MTDPGWRPAVALAARIALLRPPDGPILIVMRAAVVFLAGASVTTAVLVLVFGGGSGEARVDEVTAQIILFAAVGAAAVVTALGGRESPDTRSEGLLAAWIFRVTMLRVVAAALVGPVGLLLSWSAADGAWVIYGTGAAILLMLVVGPTRRRIVAFQDEVGDEGDVLAALLRPYR